MNQEKFVTAYKESRNGTDKFYFNKLYPRFRYSDGVRDCAMAGCYWLVDVLGLEVTREMAKRRREFTIVKVKVENEQATISCDFEEYEQEPFVKYVHTTDLPEGVWEFYISDEGELGYSCILPSEY